MSASVLICPYARLTWGHLTRCLALAEALDARGGRVRFACPSEARPRIEAAGFEHVPLVGMARQELLMPAGSTRAAAAARRWLADELAAARACLRAAAPDVVVTDLQPLVNVAAALDAVPSASVLNLELLTTPLGWWLPALERLLGELDVPRWAARRLFGDALVVADTPSALGLRDLPPDQAARIAASVRELRFVGPILGELPRRRVPAGRPRPEVIVSLGGSRKTRVADIVAGCAAVDADLVVVAPHPSDELAQAADAVRRSGRRSGRRVKVVELLPDFAARLAEADALITHGGHGTLSLAAALAVPTLVIPETPEQEINARRLHGVGAVAIGSRSRRALHVTVGDQLAALLRDRAGDPVRARLARSLASYDGAGDAALVVGRLAEAPPRAGP
ncbi:MAG TPA: nucleotide disphospho-sugar-binding domain-containing protein [Kofleriaceae bacterium]|nr:nucleotide disphospho-sugar-binding domain-containing protein [Kofleriaceae bacterium]